MTYAEPLAPPSLDTLLEDIAAVSHTLHAAGACSPKVLQTIARHLAARTVTHSVETGSGATTLLFSHLSEHHTVFALDDGSASISRVRSSLLFNPLTTSFVEGPTQQTLPGHTFAGKLQAALLDGPHAFPFPQLEYYYIYRHLEENALLILDDIHIPSIHQLYRFLKADEMFELLEVVDRAAFFRRTSVPAFDPLGDGWRMQGYNERLLLRLVWRERLRECIPASARGAAKDLARSATAAWNLLRAPKWSARILEPHPGDLVGASGIVRGTARIPPETRLWLLARRKDQNGWWPQGNGPVQLSDLQWSQHCNYGGPSDCGERFELALVVVNAADQRRLQRWVEEGLRSGNYPPVDLPRSSSCLPVKLTVVRE